MSWAVHDEGAANMGLIDSCGKALSLKIKCPVKLVVWGKPQYECYCNKIFPLFSVEGAIKTGDWSTVLDRHEGKI